MGSKVLWRFTLSIVATAAALGITSGLFWWATATASSAGTPVRPVSASASLRTQTLPVTDYQDAVTQKCDKHINDLELTVSFHTPPHWRESISTSKYYSSCSPQRLARFNVPVGRRSRNYVVVAVQLVFANASTFRSTGALGLLQASGDGLGERHRLAVASFDQFGHALTNQDAVWGEVGRFAPPTEFDTVIYVGTEPDNGERVYARPEVVRVTDGMRGAVVARSAARAIAESATVRFRGSDPLLP